MYHIGTFQTSIAQPHRPRTWCSQLSVQKPAFYNGLTHLRALYRALNPLSSLCGFLAILFLQFQPFIAVFAPTTSGTLVKNCFTGCARLKLKHCAISHKPLILLRDLYWARNTINLWQLAFPILGVKAVGITIFVYVFTRNMYFSDEYFLIVQIVQTTSRINNLTNYYLLAPSGSFLEPFSAHGKSFRQIYRKKRQFSIFFSFQ